MVYSTSDKKLRPRPKSVLRTANRLPVLVDVNHLPRIGKQRPQQGAKSDVVAEILLYKYTVLNSNSYPRDTVHYFRSPSTIHTALPFIFPECESSTIFGTSLRPWKIFVSTLMPWLPTSFSICTDCSWPAMSDPLILMSATCQYDAWDLEVERDLPLKMSSANGTDTSSG